MRSTPVTFFLTQRSELINFGCLVPDSTCFKRIVRINLAKKQVIIVAFWAFIYEIIINGISNGYCKRKNKWLASFLLQEMYLVSISVNGTELHPSDIAHSYPCEE